MEKIGVKKANKWYKKVDSKRYTQVKVTNELELEHGDRIIFGSNHMYVLYHPQDASRKIKSGKITETEANAKPSFETVQEEIAEKKGFRAGLKNNAFLRCRCRKTEGKKGALIL